MSEPSHQQRAADALALLDQESQQRVQQLVNERLDIIIALLVRLPIQYNRWPTGSNEALLRDLFPDYKLPS